MKMILDFGVLLVTILITLAVGMGFERRHFVAVARRRSFIAVESAAMKLFLIRSIKKDPWGKY